MDYHSDIERVLFTREEIEKRVSELGVQISRDYHGKDLLLLGILRGAMIFMADLIRHIEAPLEFDTVAISSYGANTRSSGVVRILKDLEDSVESRHVLVVEDIVDTGQTLRVSYLLENLRSRKAASVKVCALLDRPGRREFDIHLDYCGFTIPETYVVGYGMDYAGRYRQLPYIGVLRPEVYGGG